MPSNIINLADVVPGIEDTTFKMPDGTELVVPGDLSTETTFELLALFEDLIKFQEDASKQVATKKASAAVVSKVRADLKTVTDKIDALLLGIFQIRQPDLEKLPFGSKSQNYVLGAIFETVGLASKTELAGPLPAPPTKPTSRKGPTRKTGTTRRRK